MSEGPVSAGSITGNLKLDDSDWDAKVDAAIAKAKELGSVDPNIKVSVDDATAMSKLAEVEAAVESAGGSSASFSVSSNGTAEAIAAQDSLTASTSKAAAASAALGAAEDVQGASTAQATEAAAANLAAQNAVAAAQTRLQIATDATQLATLRLNATLDDSNATEIQAAAANLAVARAQQSQLDATTRLTAAQDALTASTEAQKTSTEGAAGQWQTIAAGVGAVIALSGPASAFIASVGGGLAGMGAAGVLAIIGINNEVKSGTVLGDEYSAGLQSLKGDLDELSNTAAVGLLSDFQQIESQVTSDMPALNSEIAGFTDQLGSGAVSALDGIIGGFRVANPLFVEGAQYVDGLAASFDEWTKDGGLQQFVTYAEAELPIVENAISSTTRAVVDLGTEMGPLGNDMLEVATFGGEVVDMLTKGQAVVDGFTKSLGPMGSILQTASSYLNPVTAIFKELGQYLPFVNQWLGSFTGSTGAAGAAASSQKPAIDNMAGSYLSLSKAESDAQAAAQSYAAYVAAQNNDALKLDQSNSTLAGSYQNIASAVTAAKTSTDKITKSQADSMDVNTAAGLQNHQNVVAAITDAQAQAAAVYQSNYDQTHSVQDATSAANAALTTAQQTINAHATAAGLDKQQVDGLTGSMLSLPPITNMKLNLDTSEARNQLSSWLAAYDAVARQTTVEAGTLAAQGKGPGHAAGGWIGHGLAAGGSPGFISGPGSTTSDSILMPLSNDEFVTKAESAQYAPNFMAAYNEDPRGALSAVAAAGAASVQSGSPTGPMQLTGNLYLDSGQLLGVITGIVQAASGQRKTAKGTGTQRAFGGK